VDQIKGALVIVDPDAAQGMDAEKGKSYFWVTGADTKDYHVKHFNWRRDVGTALDDPKKVRVADVRNAMEGDPSPRAKGATLAARRGIEVGHIFKLGTKYSQAMGFAILDEHQERRPVIMGCYGIGVSRTLAACVEMSHDENGIIWPLPLAPYHVLIVPMSVDPSSEAMRVACELSGKLSAAGFDVLVDDREERPGVKFKDADLIGVPMRIVIGDKGLAEQSVEFKRRTDAGKGGFVKIDEVVGRCLQAADGA
jgi:prolyl-tRNA synthetase